MPLLVLGVAADFLDAGGWRAVLGVVAEGFALLTLGLVRPWGEVVPGWVPLVGGRRVPAVLTVTVAALGAVAVTFLGAVAWERADGAPGSYLPLLAWGPVLAVVTVAYYLRRVSPSPTGGTGRS